MLSHCALSHLDVVPYSVKWIPMMRVFLPLSALSTMLESGRTSSSGIFPGSNNVVIAGGHFIYSEARESPSHVIPDGKCDAL